MLENMIETKEVAQILGISVQAVSRLCNRGSIPFLWLGGRRVYIRHKILLYSMDPERMKKTRKFDQEIKGQSNSGESYS